MAIYGPAPNFKRRPLSYGFSTGGSLISESAVPHCECSAPDVGANVARGKVHKQVAVEVRQIVTFDGVLYVRSRQPSLTKRHFSLKINQFYKSLKFTNIPAGTDVVSISPRVQGFFLFCRTVSPGVTPSG